MIDDIGLEGSDRRLHLLAICDVDTMQVRGGIDVFLPARAQVVDYADLVASGDISVDHVRPDETGAAGDENLQWS